MAHEDNIQNFSKNTLEDAINSASGDINSAHTQAAINLLPAALAYWLAGINLRVQALAKAKGQPQAD